MRFAFYVIHLHVKSSVCNNWNNTHALMNKILMLNNNIIFNTRYSLTYIYKKIHLGKSFLDVIILNEVFNYLIHNIYIKRY